MPEGNPMRSLDRALDLIEILEGADAPLRLTEIARLSGLHLATTQRILAALKARGRVEADGTGYTVGLAAVVGASAFATTSRLVNEVRPCLQDLSARAGLPVSLHMRLEMSRVVVERIGGDDTVQYNASIGRRLPLHLGAAKVMAALLPEPKLSELIAFVGVHRRANGATVTPDALAEELRQIRDQGYAISSQERIPNRFSVGAPIQTAPGVWDAALVISGRDMKVHEAAIPTLVANVREAAGEISSRRTAVA